MKRVLPALLAVLLLCGCGETPRIGQEPDLRASTSAAARTERDDFKDGSYAVDEYAANEALLVRTFYRADGTVEGRTEYEYDASGRCLAYTELDASGTVIRRTENEYDDAGRIVRENRYDGSGNQSSCCDWTYDAAGTLQRLEERLPDGTPLRIPQYDTQRNGANAVYEDGVPARVDEDDAQGGVRSTCDAPDGTVERGEDCAE